MTANVTFVWRLNSYFHIQPGPFDKMEVRLAAQVFSSTVAAGMCMSTVLNCGLIFNTSWFSKNDTFYKWHDTLFDIFNFRETSNSKMFNNYSLQLNHLIKMTEMFKNLKVISKNNNIDVTKRNL